MIKKDQISSLIWMFLAIYIIAASLRLPLGNWRDPGPGFLPLGSGTILFILSIINYMQAAKIASHEKKSDLASLAGKKNLLLGALFAYAFLLEVLGFLLTTFFVLFFLFKAIEPQKWIISIGGSALASILSYIIFELWLRSQLPKGFFGF